MMERTLAMIRTCVQIAWWDGSSIGLRLHRLTDLADVVSTTAEPARLRLVREVRDDRL